MTMSKIETILDSYKNGKPDAFKFYGFVSPDVTDEQYGWAKECGYTHLQAFYGVHGNDKFAEALDMAQKHDLKLVWVGTGYLDEERPYANHPALDGIYVDEPLSVGDLEMLVGEMKTFQEKYPDKYFYVNLVGMTGRSWDIYSKYFKENFLSQVNYPVASGDGYALREPDANGENTFTSVLENIREIGELAIETNSEMYYFVQTMSIHGDSWRKNPARHPSEEDIRFLHYVILSCGATSFAHFCYKTPDRRSDGLGEFMQEDYACIETDGTRTPIWYATQNVVAEFKKFENIYLKFKWKGILPIYGAKATKRSQNFEDLTKYITAHSYIQEVEAQQDLLIGCFEDKDGNIGLSLVNFCDPYLKKENPIRLKLDTAACVALIKNGDVQTIELVDGEYCAVLRPGEGQFLVIPKGKDAEIETFEKEHPVPEYLIPPKSYCWKEDFSAEVGHFVDTYNIYGSGNSHFEFMESGYPEGGSGRVVRLYSTTKRDKDWSTYTFKLPDIPNDDNKKLVFKMHFGPGAFVIYASCDHMNPTCNKIGASTLERIGEWSWFEVPVKSLAHPDIPVISEISLCIGNGVPFGTSAYIDEILLCDIE